MENFYKIAREIMGLLYKRGKVLENSRVLLVFLVKLPYTGSSTKVEEKIEAL